jgi:hypothetical protein
MNHGNLLQQTLVLTLVVILLAGCGGTQVEPTAVSTPIPPTATPTSVPPTDTPTSVPPTDTPPTTGKIIGVIINNATGDPEESLAVNLMTAEPETDSTRLVRIEGSPFIVATDSSGAFTIDNIEPGMYGIMVSASASILEATAEVSTKALPDCSSTSLQVPAEYCIPSNPLFGLLLKTEDGDAAITIDAGQTVDLGQVPYILTR